MVGDLPFRKEGTDTVNTAVWDIAWVDAQLVSMIAQARAMADELDFVLLKVSPKDVNMVTDVLERHMFTVCQWFWYKTDQNMMTTFKPVPAVECLVYGYRSTRVEELFALCDKNPELRHNVVLGTSLRARMKDDKNEDYNIAQSPLYLWYYLLHDLGGGVDVIIDVCAGTGSATVAALELGYNVISVEKNARQFEGLTRRLELVHKDLHSEEGALAEDWTDMLKKKREDEGIGGTSYQSFEREKEIKDLEKQIVKEAKMMKEAAKKAPAVLMCGMCDAAINEDGELKCCLCGVHLHEACSADGDMDKMEDGSTCLGRQCQKMGERDAKKQKKKA